MKTLVAWITASLLAHPSVPSEPRLTPAQRDVAAAEKVIARRPDDSRPYANLALALARRARETADTAYYLRAEEAVQRSLELAPDNYGARRARAWILLGQHEFARALEEATALNRRAPDDLMVYGFLVDANAELGRYDDAEEAAQWMLDLRQGNVSGLTRAAYLRELFGDLEGALELMTAAHGRVSPSEVEDRAWILSQIGHLQLEQGRPETAAAALEQALQQFPGYHYALAELARVRTAQGRLDAAVDLYQARYRAAPHPECLYELATALERAGRGGEARSAFLEFERRARAESEGWDNANRELVFYYVDQANRPAEALRIARLEFERRRNVHTREILAWALHANDQDVEARAQIEAALAVGIRKGEMQYRAGVIVAAAGDPTAAREHLSRAATSPFPDVKAAATEALMAMEAAAAASVRSGLIQSAATAAF